MENMLPEKMLVHFIENEHEGPATFYNDLFWSARLGSYALTDPGGYSSAILSKLMWDDYFDNEKNMTQQVQIRHKHYVEAEWTLGYCIDIVANELMASRPDSDYHDKSALYYFCKHEILSCFPGVAAKCGYEILSCFLGNDEKSDLWHCEISDLFTKIDSQYPSGLLATIQDLIEHTRTHIDAEYAESMLENYLRNSLERYGAANEAFSFIFYNAIVYCSLNFESETIVNLYDTFISYVHMESQPVEYSDILCMVAGHLPDSRLNQASNMLHEALQIRLYKLDEKHIATGVTYCQIAIIKWKQKDWLNCISAGIKAYEIFPKDNLTVQLGFCLTFVLNSYLEIEKYDECPRWIEVIEKIYDMNKNELDATDLFINLSIYAGFYYQATKQLALSEKYYRKGLIIAKKYGIADKEAALASNLAKLLGFVGVESHASDELLAYIPDTPAAPSGNKTLSLMYKTMALQSWTSDDAERYAKLAYDEISVNPNEPHFAQSITYANFLLLNQKHHQYHDLILQLISDSEREINEYYSNLDKIPNSAIVEISYCKALFYLKLGDSKQAIRYATDAVRLSVSDEMHYNIMTNCGTIFTSLGDKTNALIQYNAAIEVVLERLNAAKKYLDDSRVRTYLDAVRHVTNNYFSLVSDGTTSADFEEQYNVVLKTKSLPSLIEKAKKDASIVNSSQRLILDKIQSLKEQPGSDDEIKALELDYAVADTSVLHLRATTVEDVKRALPPNSALVEYYEYVEYRADRFDYKLEEHDVHVWYAVFVTVKDANGNVDFFRDINIDALHIKDTAKELRHAISVQNEANDNTHNQNYINERIQELRKELYGLIIADTYPYLTGCRQVFFAPDSDLATIPFEILGSNWHLMDCFKIIYLETGRDIKSNSGTVDMNDTSIVIGYPEYEIDMMPRPKRPGKGKLNSRALSNKPEVLKLPMSRFEARVVAERLGTTPLLGKHATKYAVLGSDSPKVIHISTHGDVADLDTEEDIIPINPMDHAYLLMAGAVTEHDNDNPIPPFGNGILTAKEVAGCDFTSTDLVVLSACVTGLGWIMGSEVIGMKLAFKIAGAKNIVVSLWSVDDFATAVFMHILYSNLSSYDIHTAMYKSKKIMKSLTIHQLKRIGFFSDEAIKKMGTASGHAEYLKTMNDNHTPFSNEKDWAGFICQQN